MITLQKPAIRDPQKEKHILKEMFAPLANRILEDHNVVVRAVLFLPSLSPSLTLRACRQ